MIFLVWGHMGYFLWQFSRTNLQCEFFCDRCSKCSLTEQKREVRRTAECAHCALCVTASVEGQAAMKIGAVGDSTRVANGRSLAKTGIQVHAFCDDPFHERKASDEDI